MLTGTPRAYQSCALTKGGSGVDATLICALIHRCDPAGSVTAAAGTAVRASSCIRFLRKSGSDAARIIVTSPLVGPFEAYVIAYPSIATIAQLPQNPCLHAPTANSVCQAVIQRCLNERRGCADPRSSRPRPERVDSTYERNSPFCQIEPVCNETARSSWLGGSGIDGEGSGRHRRLRGHELVP